MNASNFRPGSTIGDLKNEMIDANVRFPYLESYFENISSSIPHLLSRFKVFPSFNDIADFQSRITATYIPQQQDFPVSTTETEYNTFKNIYYSLNCKNLTDFLDVHLRAENLILIDIFEHYRHVSFKDYGLDPVYMYSLSGYSLHCAFFYNRLEVDLVSDPKMCDLINDGLRGGTVHLGVKHVVSNTKRYGDFDAEKEEQEILSIDMNSQYSDVMANEYLPKGSFEWVPDNELDALDFRNMKTDGEFGIIARVSIFIPNYLHDFLSNFPPISEKSEVSFTNLSGEQKKFVSESETKISFKEKRNLSTLFPKLEQVFHFKNIQFFVRLGCIILKVHSAIRFKQAKLFEQYISFNNEKRKVSTSTLMKNNYKLQNNVLSGRLNIDPLNYTKNEFVLSSVRAKHLLARHDFLDIKPVANSKTCTLFRMKKTKSVDLNFRVIAMVIYELSKIKILEFLYFKIYPAFGINCVSVAHSHTDSLLCSIRVDSDTYIKRMKELSPLMDYSNLDPSHELYSKSNYCVMGKMKMTDHIIEFIGIKPSQYSLKFANESEKCKCSGVPKRTQKSEFRHEVYREALRNENRNKVDIDTVRMVDGKIVNLTVKRFGLGGIDVSRYFINNYFSLPFGHWKLANAEQEK